MKTLGLRHVALNVLDPTKTKDFYIKVLKMELEWEPDAENIYLTSGGLDNLAIHKVSTSKLIAMEPGLFIWKIRTAWSSR
jgi:catechol 2,3-dioxygenase-like lactoylglutathione lyase family enzyme